MKKTLAIVGLTLALTTPQLFAVTAGTVNGMEISVEEANQVLKNAREGKQEWSKLNTEEKKQLIQMMSVGKLIGVESKKVLTQQEKDAAISTYWMQKKISTTPITDQEAQAAYNRVKEAAKKAKNKQEMPPFEAVKNNIKMQLAQEKVVGELIKSAKIDVK
ncbi:MAG: hypothetical protein RLZZ428_780 [Pseudomonadota bacterium]|jgi:hypothetical protein